MTAALTSTAPRRAFPSSGVHCPLVTPFDPSTGGVAVEALKKQVVRLADAGMGIVLLGTNGEGEPTALHCESEADDQPHSRVSSLTNARLGAYLRHSRRTGSSRRCRAYLGSSSRWHGRRLSRAHHRAVQSRARGRRGLRHCDHAGLLCVRNGEEQGSHQVIL